MDDCRSIGGKHPGGRPKLSFTWTRSLRFRLTAWYTLTLAVILTVAGLAAYHVAKNIVLRETDGYLALESRRIRAAVAQTRHPAHQVRELQESLGEVQGGALKSQALPGFILFEAMYGRAVDPSTGAVLAVSPNLARHPDVSPTLDGVFHRKPARLTFAGPDEERTMRILSEPIIASGRSLVLQLAVPWDDNEDAIERFGLSLCLCIPILVAISAIGGWVMVGRTLRPIGRIVAESDRVDIRSLSGALLPAPAETDSEVGRLVVTLNSMAARMHRAFDTQRRFAADASHELRTPLTFLRGEIEYTLLRPRETDVYRNALENAITAIDELSGIVESLSYLARLDSGESGSRRTPARVDLSTLVDSLAREYEPEAVRKSITLTLHTHDPSVRVHGDEEQLRLMLRNLVDNAIKYTPEHGSVDIVVALKPRVGREEAEITVADTGVGIEPDEIDRVFERFWRADRARSTAGTGLGLSIALQIAESHGGTIAVASKPGEGSVFTVRLPSMP